MIPCLVYGKAIGITSGIFVRNIGLDAWSSMLIGFIIGVIIVAITAYLGSKFPEKTIVQYSEELLGKWIGKAIGLLLAAFFIFAFALSADTMICHLKDYFLPETPLWVICAIYAALCMYGVRLGFEVVVRVSLIGFLMLVLLNITMVIGTVHDFDFANLMPLFDTGIVNNIGNSFYAFGDISMAILAVAVIYPTLNNKKKTVSLSLWSMVVATVMVVAWPFFETGVLGTDVMSKFVVVCMEQIRAAQITRYFPRAELLMVGFFVFTMYVQSSAMLHCSKYSIKQITGIKRDWFILAPITLIGAFLSYLLIRDHNMFVDFLSYPWAQVCAVLGVGLPVLLFIVALARGKLRKQQKAR